MKTIKHNIFGEIVKHQNVVVYNQEAFNLLCKEDLSILEDRLYSSSDFDACFNLNFETMIEDLISNLSQEDGDNEDGDLLKRYPTFRSNQKIALAITSHELELLKLLQNESDDIRVFLFKNKAAISLFDDLIQNINPSYMDKAVLSGLLSKEQIDYLIQYGDYDLVLFISKQKNLELSDQSLKTLLEHTAEEIRINALSLKNVKEEKLLYIAMNTSLSVDERAEAIVNLPNISHDFAVKIFSENKIELLRALSKNINIDHETILKLYKTYDKTEEIRRNLFQIQYKNIIVPYELVREASLNFSKSISLPFINNFFDYLKPEDVEILIGKKDSETLKIVNKKMETRNSLKPILSLKSTSILFLFKLLSKLRLEYLVFDRLSQ
jgi:hypothetical protein